MARSRQTIDRGRKCTWDAYGERASVKGKTGLGTHDLEFEIISKANKSNCHVSQRATSQLCMRGMHGHLTFCGPFLSLEKNLKLIFKAMFV